MTDVELDRLEGLNGGTGFSPDNITCLIAAARERNKLQAFKDWVHAYLDRNGVPTHPPGPHGAEGCRIGDRMDWLMALVDEVRADRDKLAAELAELRRACRAIREWAKAYDWTWDDDFETPAPAEQNVTLTVGQIRDIARLIPEPEAP